MNIYIDCEFTGLQQNTTLISLGCVAEDGRQFYAESIDYDKSLVNDWIQENVINNLYLESTARDSDLPTMTMASDGDLWTIIGHDWQIRKFFQLWIKDYERIQMWSDVYAYDWMLFCELFDAPDTAERLPRNIFYIPLDLATLMWAKMVDPDISREEFSGIQNLKKHNALDDAKIIKACYEKLMGIS